MIDSGVTVNVIPATFVKDNKMEHLLKKGKKLDISVYGGKKVRTEGTMRVELINPVNRRKVTASIMVVNEKMQRKTSDMFRPQTIKQGTDQQLPLPGTKLGIHHTQVCQQKRNKI